ncbi:6719_t:CDS:1, partial [Dentiscutata heterogama]
EIDNYSFVSPQPWSSPCSICNEKHGNYGLHGKWYKNETEYCLTCNSLSNEL